MSLNSVCQSWCYNHAHVVWHHVGPWNFGPELPFTRSVSPIQPVFRPKSQDSFPGNICGVTMDNGTVCQCPRKLMFHLVQPHYHSPASKKTTAGCVNGFWIILESQPSMCASTRNYPQWPDHLSKSTWRRMQNLLLVTKPFQFQFTGRSKCTMICFLTRPWEL